MVGLAQLATPKRYTNVLQHVAVYFKGSARCAGETREGRHHRRLPAPVSCHSSLETH
jgi:hypothetical protein